MYKSAIISEDGKYRYQLVRTWDTTKPPVTWIMLNPSTADAEKDDPTIRRCIGFAKRWGKGGIYIFNLFAFRATSPQDLMNAYNPEGGGLHSNQDEIKRHLMNKVPEIVCAWGNYGGFRDQGSKMIAYLHLFGVQLKRIGSPTKSGQPKHPLHLAYALQLEPHDDPDMVYA